MAAEAHIILVQEDPRHVWTAALGGMLAVSVVYGLAYSYGQFLAPMATTFGAGEGAGSVVFSITSFTGFCLSVITGPIADRYGARTLLVCGAVCIAIGLIATAQSTSFWTASLAYGLGVGMGIGLVYVPVLASVGKTLEQHRTMATGLVVTGVGVGTLAGAPLSAIMIAAFGWRNTFLTYGVICPVAILLSSYMLGRPFPNSVKRGLLVPTYESRLALFYLSTLLINIIIYVPYVHLSVYAVSRFHVDPISAATLISTIGISNISARILITLLSYLFRPLSLFVACHVGLATSFAIWLFAPSYTYLYAFSVAMGASHGAYSALIPIVVAREFGPDRLGRILGILFTAVGLGSAVGPALTGYLVETSSSYSVALSLFIAIGISGAVTLAVDAHIRSKIKAYKESR